MGRRRRKKKREKKRKEEDIFKTKILLHHNKINKHPMFKEMYFKTINY